MSVLWFIIGFLVGAVITFMILVIIGLMAGAKPSTNATAQPSDNQNDT